ncbi:MAG TPA: hypothetical protein PKN29_11840 [Candidatus Ozemobacteraceae bacterium]|nr:hypothetical protein [Candidatus Ozemobacteraceae bacterium]
MPKQPERQTERLSHQKNRRTPPAINVCDKIKSAAMAKMTPPSIVTESPTEVDDIQQVRAFESRFSIMRTGNDDTRPANNPLKTPVVNKPVWKFSTRSQGLPAGETSDVTSPARSPEKMISQ